MLAIRNAHAGEIYGIGFDANGGAAYCLQLTHVTDDANVTQSWTLRNCLFANATRYNVLIGDAQAGYSQTGTYGEGAGNPPACGGDVSLLRFEGCMFLRSFLGSPPALRAHVMYRASQSFNSSMHNCTLDGSGTAPKYGIEIEAGTMCFSSMVSQLGGSSGLATDLFLNPLRSNVSPNRPLAPPAVTVTGWESQLPCFLDCGPHAASGGACQWPTTLTGVHHGSQTTTSGSRSVGWTITGWGFLSIFSSHFNRDVNFGGGEGAYVHGLVFDDTTVPGTSHHAGFVVGSTVTDYPSVVHGEWNFGTVSRSRIHNANLIGDTTFDPNSSGTSQLSAPLLTSVGGTSTPLGNQVMAGFMLMSLIGNAGYFGASALYALNGNNNSGAPSGTTTLISGSASLFGTVAGSSSTLNVYWSATNLRFELQNTSGSYLGLRITFIGHGQH